jgi:carbon storage regulator
MLVLRRKVGERIIIDGSIEVTVLRVCGNKVRLGFSAPTGVRVDREEAARKREPVASQEPDFVEVDAVVS